MSDRDATVLKVRLSGRSMQALDELKRKTDAVTTADVFRNALRLHLALVRAHENGARLLVQEPGRQAVPVEISSPAEEQEASTA